MRKLKRRSNQIRQTKNRNKPKVYTYNFDDKKFIAYVKAITGIDFYSGERQNLTRFFLTNPNAEPWIRRTKKLRYLTGKMIPFDEREKIITQNRKLKNILQAQWDNYIDKPRAIKRRKKPRKIKRRANK